MDREQIEKLILLMKQHDLAELQVKQGDFEFAARRGEKPQVLAVPAGGVPVPAPAPLACDEGAKPGKEITSPIVGTFYRAPAPDQPPYKETGDRVTPEDVVGLVEAMKVMNEIKAGVSGTIRKVLVENAAPVEFGTPLFLVEVG
jgi:acetyl-CoA carboxylase biotin carboxyl carrier protein